MISSMFMSNPDGGRRPTLITYFARGDFSSPLQLFDRTGDLLQNRCPHFGSDTLRSEHRILPKPVPTFGSDAFFEHRILQNRSPLLGPMLSGRPGRSAGAAAAARVPACAASIAPEPWARRRAVA